MNINLLPLYRFWVEVVISFSILLFCGVNLTLPAKGRANSSLYSNLIFLVIGYWIPSNSSPKKEGQTIANSEQTIYVEKSKE